MNSLDWSRVLDYWNGPLEWTTGALAAYTLSFGQLEKQDCGRGPWTRTLK